MTDNLPYTDKSINKAFDEYFERKLNEKMYGYPFIEKEVLKNKNGAYLLYDPEMNQDLLKIQLLVFLVRLVGHTEF